MSRIRSSLISILTAVVSLLVSAEILSFVYVSYVLRDTWRPNYFDAATQAAWWTETNDWGAWHVPNASTRFERVCFSVALRSNSYGARDRERPRDVTGDHRVVVLGDSFAEGYGVDAEDRLSDRLEHQLGIEFLNFGTAYDFGPMQYQILYDRLAANFAHDQVVVLFLPANDFTDNDAEFWYSRRPGEFERRHRPYYRQTADHNGYAPFYPDAPSRPNGAAATSAAHTLFGDIRHWIGGNLWVSQAVRRAQMLLGARGYSGYYDFEQRQLDAVLWSFSKIKERAGTRTVTFVVVPTLRDFDRRGQLGESTLIATLRQFGAAHDFGVVDLLEPMRAMGGDPARFFLGCDGHWSREGNQAAADVLLRQVVFPASGHQ
jgi:lysophospholipase L1-like esterase